MGAARWTWKGTENPVGRVSWLGGLLLLVSSAFLVVTNGRVPWVPLGVGTGFVLTFAGMVFDHGGFTPRVKVLVVLGLALIALALFGVWLANH